MSETVVLYFSQHHGNTKKLLDAIKRECDVDLVCINDAKTLELEAYSTVGFASGIYKARVAEPLSRYVRMNQDKLKGKDTFIITTAGSSGKKGVKAFSQELEQAGMNIKGKYECNGYDTYGLFKLIGGIRKNHPTSEECMQAVGFYKSIR